VPAFLHRIRDTIRRYHMATPGDRIGVGVSGGPDSVALLAALAELSTELRVELCVLHFNHHLRADADADQECVETVAAALGVPCVVGDSESLHGGGNLEERAREQRYAFFTRAASRHGCARVATGHTADDQAETVLMRLLRGAGADGLAGIPPVRDGFIIRPLLECRRQQVLEFLETRGLPYRADASNFDRRHLRNRVRHEVLPLLSSINPRLPQTLPAMARVWAAEAAYLNEEADRRATQATGSDGSLAVAAISGAPAALQPRVVRAWLRGERGDLRRIEATHVRAVVTLATGSRCNAVTRLPGNSSVVREYERLYLLPQPAEPVAGPGCQPLWPAAAVSVPPHWRFTTGLLCCGPLPWRQPASLWEFLADAEALPRPLLVRQARPGDRIRPLGMTGRRKLQDVFVDRRVEILWVPGVVRSAHALVTTATRCACRIHVQEQGVVPPQSVC
jgi:tRNA(Ile)-lysidine synthase